MSSKLQRVEVTSLVYQSGIHLRISSSVMLFLMVFARRVQRTMFPFTYPLSSRRLDVFRAVLCV